MKPSGSAAIGSPLHNPDDRRWQLTAWLLILAVAVLSSSQWPLYPYFMDSYYHLGVIQGFRQAGGIALNAFWEAAPEGRPQLYPPLFHLLFLPAFAAGVDPLTLAKFWSWAAMPFLLLIGWLVFSRIMTARAACLMLIALATPYGFFLSSANHAPATLALAATLGILLALSKGRWLAGGLLLGMAFWLHAGLPWLGALGLILFGVMAPPFRKRVFLTVGIGIASASPWLLHLFRHRTLLSFHPRGEDLGLESSLVLVALGLLGLKRAWKEPSHLGRFFVALWIGFLPMVFFYRFRFLSAEGLFPSLLLAGVTLEGWAQKLKSRWVIVGALAFVLLGTPTLYRSGNDGLRLAWADTTLSVLGGRVQPIARPGAQPLFNKRFMSELATRIQAHTKPEDLIYCNLPYIAGMLSILTDRATTNQMLRELADRPQEEEIRRARLIIWIKEDASGRPSRFMEGVVLEHNLFPLGETPIAYLYLNRHASAQRRIGRSVVPWWVAYAITMCAVWLLWQDLRRPSSHGPRFRSVDP